MTDQLARRFIFRLFSRHPATSGSRSPSTAGASPSGPSDARRCTRAINVHSPHVYRQLLRGSNGLAETYMDGHWDVDDMVALIRIAARNMRGMDRCARRAGTRCCTPASAWREMVPRNDRDGRAGATSPPTTTWATSSSRCSSTPR